MTIWPDPERKLIARYIAGLNLRTTNSPEPRRDCRRLPLLRLRSHHDETERQYLFT